MQTRNTQSRVRKTWNWVKKNRVAIQATAIGCTAAYYTTTVVWQVRSDKMRREMAAGHFMIPLEKPNRYVRIPVYYDPDAEAHQG